MEKLMILIVYFVKKETIVHHWQKSLLNAPKENIIQMKDSLTLPHVKNAFLAAFALLEALKVYAVQEVIFALHLLKSKPRALRENLIQIKLRLISPHV